MFLDNIGKENVWQSSKLAVDRFYEIKFVVLGAYCFCTSYRDLKSAKWLDPGICKL